MVNFDHWEIKTIKTDAKRNCEGLSMGVIKNEPKSPYFDFYLHNEKPPRQYVVRVLKSNKMALARILEEAAQKVRDIQ